MHAEIYRALGLGEKRWSNGLTTSSHHRASPPQLTSAMKPSGHCKHYQHGQHRIKVLWLDCEILDRCSYTLYGPQRCTTLLYILVQVLKAPMNVIATIIGELLPSFIKASKNRQAIQFIVWRRAFHFFRWPSNAHSPLTWLLKHPVPL
jgi:hypothetical protein